MTDSIKRQQARKAVADLIAQAAALHPNLIQAEAKSINEVVNQYRNTLTNFAYDAMTGRMGVTDTARAMRALIRELADEVYIEGMREGGITTPEEVLDVDDETAIKAWEGTQTPYVREFAKACAAVKSAPIPDMARAEVLNRIGYWVTALELFGKQGYAAAKKNQMGTWKYGDTEHCDVCRRLNNKRRRLKWFVSNGYIPQQPGSETLDCHGYNCECRIVNDIGEQLMP